jgi:non-ribosomal peptide synthetase component F
LIIGLLGILKAGGACVPLDPGYPAARLAFMLKETRAPVLLTQQGLLELLPPFAGRILSLDRDWRRSTRTARRTRFRTSQRSPSPTSSTPPDSTGEPKGILLPHATLGNLIAWHGAGTPGGRVAQFTSIGFDVSFQEILYALLSGKALVVVDDDTRLQPDRLATFMQDHAITDLFVPTSFWSTSPTPSCSRGAICQRWPMSIRGEALTITPAVQAFFEHHPTAGCITITVLRESCCHRGNPAGRCQSVAVQTGDRRAHSEHADLHPGRPWRAGSHRRDG